MVETLLASAPRTANGTGNAVTLHRGLKALEFLLTLTNADKDAGDTLNIYIQESIDNSNWNDIISFVQLNGESAAQKILAKINCQVAPETELGAMADGSLAAGSVLQGPVGPYLRAKWVLVDSGDADQTFTFGISYVEIR